MTTTTDPFLADAFFDAPGLLAVRFARRGGKRADDRLAAFVNYRRPDVSQADNAAVIGKVIGVGIFVAFIGFPLLRSCVPDNHTEYAYNSPTVSVSGTNDSPQHPAWAIGLERLADDLAPTRSDLQPWMIRTLLDVPRTLLARGVDTEDWLQPRRTEDDRRAHLQGKRLADMLISAGAGRDLALILDLPGPSAVAAAAGMAPRFDPVFTMDNLPHPSGVVPAMQTLAAAASWRPEFIAARRARSADAPALFVLEGDRLKPYANEVERFDNRSAVRLPDADAFKALGVSRILYVRAQRGAVVESDDLNERFTDLATAGIEVKHLALESVDLPQVAERQVEATTKPPETTTSHHWFWNHYGWYRPLETIGNGTSDPDADYRAKPRPTMFSHGSPDPALDGGRSQREALLTRLTPPPRPVVSGSSGSSSRFTTSGNSRPNNSSSHTSGGSWVRSSSHSSG